MKRVATDAQEISYLPFTKNQLLEDRNSFAVESNEDLSGPCNNETIKETNCNINR